MNDALVSLEQQLSSLGGGSAGAAVERARGDARALRFHCRETDKRRPPVVVVLGGTGTGKSTIVNRLLGANISEASFRRTFTAGAIAVAVSGENLQADWLGIPHAVATALPARGAANQLIVVAHDSELTQRATLIDTPDLDGDQPLHHGQADRAFRWAEAIVVLVTPEKYQMTELAPYYRLARRYGVPSIFVMNKAEELEVVEDYRARLSGERVYAIPRDDANFEPPAEINLDALRGAIANLARPEAAAREEGLKNRAADLVDRLHDQVIAPLAADRRETERTIGMLRAMETPQPGVDVNPITRSLARRLQQRSILYLMGPARVLDRVRQVPALVARLPRTAWDFLMHGKVDLASVGDNGNDANMPDFPAILSEQLAVLQSRIDDTIRQSDGGEKWIERDPEGYRAAIFETSRAAAIAVDELQQLRMWLETRWNATPRDTALLQKVIKHVPGGQKLTQWSEAAPYLLTIVVATHHAFFGHIDLLILGGYSLATWLSERASNEVAARTRQANRSIADRFAQLAHEQIERVVKWLEGRAPSLDVLDKIRKTAEELV
jgi:hypothetical protein